MEIELLVVTDCPNDPVAAELISRALVDAGVKATVMRTVSRAFHHFGTCAKP
jgi:hypothetical protein